MLDETDLLNALRRHWEHSGKDEDLAHEIYHADAVLEFPSPASGSKAWRTPRVAPAVPREISSSTCAASAIARTWS